MCCLKLSKNIIPFAVTFSIGILLVCAFTNTLSCFTSSSNVETHQVNEVKIYSSDYKNKSMYNMKDNELKIVGETEDSELYIHPSDALTIEKIVIKEEVK